MVHEPLRLLVVDDNRDAADSLAVLLRMLGQSPRVAYDGATAIEAAHRDPPDAVFLDLAIPLVDGYRIAERLRRSDTLKDVPIVALTGFADQVHRDRAFEVGFDRYTVKPVDEPTLRRLVDELAEVRRAGGGVRGARARGNDAPEEGSWAPGG